MIELLWKFVRDLWEARERIPVWRAARAAERKLVELQRATRKLLGEDAALDEELLAFDRGVVLGPDFRGLSDALLQRMGDEAAACVRSGGRTDAVVARACVVLHEEGFAAAEIAALLGDERDGAVERVRKRFRVPR